MSEMNEPGSTPRRNPLIWIALAVAGLVLFVFLNGDRGSSVRVVKTPETSEAVGSVERSLLVPPGMRARQYLEQLRAKGKPYPLQEVFDKAQKYLQEGSLADAHLLYFFGAREDYLPSIMVMGEMADPTLFRAEDSLLDHADVIQAYKWYQKAAEMGQQTAAERLENLQRWAIAEAEFGNPEARQLLLNFK
ncbi:MAG: hypothetical protein OEO19_19370 [Gammaproteobacteria bacterium]|nr:hypothetical protein [Gammaproteobacteria bacterium]